MSASSNTPNKPRIPKDRSLSADGVAVNVEEESNEQVKIVCPSEIHKLYKGKFEHQFESESDFNDHICGSIKMQSNDGQIAKFPILNQGTMGIVNCDLKSKISGKDMYAIIQISSDEPVLQLSRFLCAKAVHKMAKRFNIESYQLPKSSRKNEDLQQQLVQPHIDDIREGIDSECEFDHLPCIPMLTFDSDRHYVKWAQIIYEKPTCIYRMVGFKYIKRCLLIAGYIREQAMVLKVSVPNDLLTVIIVYSPNVMVTGDVALDGIKSRNKLLAPLQSVVTDESLNKFTRWNKDLCLNADGSSAFAYPPYL